MANRLNWIQEEIDSWSEDDEDENDDEEEN